MNVYKTFLQLHIAGFILCNLLFIVFLFRSPYILLVLITKPIGYFAIYLITRPKYSRYDYYFKNLGFSAVRLFLILSLMDFSVFSIFVAPLRLLF